jgi:hypothetical protein
MSLSWLPFSPPPNMMIRVSHPLSIVHPPAWTEMFLHFKDAFDYWFYITEVATLCFIETAA